MKMPAQCQIQEYNQTAAALAILNEKYSGQQYETSTATGMSEAKKARAEIKGYRVALEKLRVELKAPALERSRLIDAEAKRIAMELVALEAPIDAQIKAEETRIEEEIRVKAKAETDRLAAIAAKINDIRVRYLQATKNQTAEVISSVLDEAQALELSESEYQEFLNDAQTALRETIADLSAELIARTMYEDDQKQIKAEREELARLRAQVLAEQAEQAEQSRLEVKPNEEDSTRRTVNALGQVVDYVNADPIADIKAMLNASPGVAKALDQAYQRGYEAGITFRQAA